MRIIYKILFEIRLLHEFYLTKPDGTSIFGAASPAARTAWLQDFFDRGQRSINSDIDYLVPESAQSLFKNYRLKLIPTYSGFKVAMEVHMTTDSGKTAFSPVAAPPPGLNIPILLIATSGDFDTYTNTRMNPPFDSIFYLSNSNATGLKTAPFLTNPIAAQSAAINYEQGELSQAAGVVNAFYFDGVGDKIFKPVAGKNFLNEADRNLVYPSFQYYFQTIDNVKNVVFTLTDKDSQEVYKNTINSNDPLGPVRLRVDEQKIRTVAAGAPEEASVYTLTVTGDGNYNKTYKLLFLSESLSSAGARGMINLISRPADPAFQLIDDKGLLITRVNPNGTEAIIPPVFEVWVKSRTSFWRYNNDQGGKLKDKYPTVLKLTENNLVSLAPQSHTYVPTPVQGQRFPNPKLFSPVKPEGQQVFADILVPTSDIFPLGP